MMPVELSAGRAARETDHRQDSPQPRTQQEADACLPHLCSFALCSAVGITSVLKLCADVLQQPLQHHYALIFTLNERTKLFQWLPRIWQ